MMLYNRTWIAPQLINSIIVNNDVLNIRRFRYLNKFYAYKEELNVKGNNLIHLHDHFPLT